MDEQSFVVTVKPRQDPKVGLWTLVLLGIIAWAVVKAC